MELRDITGRIEFDPILHTYILDGDRFLIGVTGLMGKHRLGYQYNESGIGKDRLERAAELGSQAHAAIEAYCDGEQVEDTPLIQSFRALGLNIVATEYMVSDLETYASSIDLVAEVEDGVYDLYDMKRTTTLHKDSLAWQLGFYKYSFERQNPGARVRNCYAIKIRKGDADDISQDTCAKPVLVSIVSEAEMDAVVAAERAGEIYASPETQADPGVQLVPIQEVVSVADAVRSIAQLEEAIKAYKDYLQKHYDIVMKQMEDNGMDEWTTPYGTYKIKAAYQRETIDSAKLKKDYPEVANVVTKTTTVKATIKFTPNGD